jgi:hypothetical protein
MATVRTDHRVFLVGNVRKHRYCDQYEVVNGSVILQPQKPATSSRDGGRESAGYFDNAAEATLYLRFNEVFESQVKRV